MSDFRFDERAALGAERFFERLLRHTEGEWAGQPFVLEGWQRTIVRDVFGWKRPDGLRRYRRVYIEIPRKNGKALSVDTWVPTVEGWKRHGDLKMGDEVFGPDGQPRRVLASTPLYMGPCYEVKFSDKTSIQAHANHEWVTERSWYTKRAHGSRGPLPTVTTEEIRATLRGGARGDLVHRIRVTAALELPDRELLIDPYVLGVWLGDGHSAAARVTNPDAEVLEELARRGYVPEAQSGPYTYLVGRGRLQRELRLVGVLHNKHVPPEYLRASKAQRMDLLRGLMDTDGYVSKAGQCEMTLTSEYLFTGVVELLRSLGYKTTVKEDRAILYGRDVGPRYRAQFWGFADDPPALLPRKAGRLKARPGRLTRNGRLMVVSVEPVGERLVNCIQVEGGLYLAGEGMTPTHNSTFAAGLALYLLFADGEPGAKVFSAAADRDQAAIVFDQAKLMVENSPALGRYGEVYKRSIVVPSSGSAYRVLSADAPTKHGLNAHGIVFDELHAQPNRDLWDVMTTSTAARRQPLLIAITTAGYNRESICWEQHEYARRVQEGIVDDPETYAFIAAADEDDDWTAPATWAKANPSLGVTLKEEYLATECARAQQTPAYQNTFRRLHLNQWTQQSERWLDLTAWDASAFEVDAKALEGRLCYGGLDLASTSDVAALALVFPPDTRYEIRDTSEEGKFEVLVYFWIPRDNMIDRARRDRVPYDAWVRDGFMQATEGNVIDLGIICRDIVALGKRYNIREIAFDRWGAVQVSQTLEGAGFEMVGFGQGFASMATPTRELLRLVLGGNLAHGGQPVLRWMADNLVVTQDPAGNVKPDKKKSREKIDGMVAVIMGLDRALRHGGDKKSVYEGRGIVSL